MWCCQVVKASRDHNIVLNLPYFIENKQNVPCCVQEGEGLQLAIKFQLLTFVPFTLTVGLLRVESLNVIVEEQRENVL